MQCIRRGRLASTEAGNLSPRAAMRIAPQLGVAAGSGPRWQKCPGSFTHTSLAEPRVFCIPLSHQSHVLIQLDFWGRGQGAASHSCDRTALASRRLLHSLTKSPAPNVLTAASWGFWSGAQSFKVVWKLLLVCLSLCAMCLRSNCGLKVVYRNELEIGNLFGLYRFNIPKESAERK